MQALSGRGNDLTFERVRFLGIEPLSGTASAVYSNGYGVACKACSFLPTRPQPPVTEQWLELEEPEPVVRSGPTDTTRWPSLHCGPATEADLASCAEACGERPLGHCRRTWQPSTETCVPEPICAMSGELLLE